MSTAVKNQLRVCILSLKYNMMREMVNRVTFLTNIGFMILNNSTILVQWVILFGLRGEVGGYSMREIMLLWALTASSFGLSHILFARAFSLSELIVNGKLDAYLVQPKNVLASVATSATDVSAIGDLLYGLGIMAVLDLGIKGILLFLLFMVTGTIIFTSFALIFGSLSFWFVRMDMLADQAVMGMVSFATYPDGIFEGASRFLLYFVIPVGMAVWHPVHGIVGFDAATAVSVLGYAVFLAAAAVCVFYRGLKRYASGSLMAARL